MSAQGKHTPKACPFCGGMKIKTGTVRDGRTISCAGCGACITSFLGPETIPSADERNLEKWNGRPVEDDLLKALEEARGYIQGKFMNVPRPLRGKSREDELLRMIDVEIAKAKGGAS